MDRCIYVGVELTSNPTLPPSSIHTEIQPHPTLGQNKYVPGKHKSILGRGLSSGPLSSILATLS
jgi:hypothetical protein